MVTPVDALCSTPLVAFPEIFAKVENNTLKNGNVANKVQLNQANWS